MTQSAAPTVPRNSLGISALLLAVIGLLLGLLRLSGLIAVTLGVLAVLLGLLGWSRIRRGVATNRTMTVIGMVLGIGTATLGAWSVASELDVVNGPAGRQDDGHAPAAMDDVAVVDCSVTAEAVNATVRITNTTDRAQMYLTTIKVNDAGGGRVGRINTVSNALGAGQSVTVSGVDVSNTTVKGTRHGPASCVVVNVSRFPAPMSCPPGEVDAKLC